MAVVDGRCDFIRAFGNWSSAICPGVGVSVALPEPTNNDPAYPFIAGKIFTNGALVVNVSEIADCAGNFRIGACTGYNGSTVTYFADAERGKLPLIVMYPQQCVKIEHLPSDWATNQSCVGEPLIVTETMLIGDYCVDHPSSVHCEKGKFNPLATARPPPPSHAPTSVKQSLLIALSTVAIVAVSVM